MPIQKQKTAEIRGFYLGSPNQIRTGVLALKGRCPGPLDDGAKTVIHLEYAIQNAGKL